MPNLYDAMSVIIDIIFIVVIIFLLFLLVTRIGGVERLVYDLKGFLNGTSGLPSPFSQSNLSIPQSHNASIPKINQSQLAAYALSLINKDRAQYGLGPVNLSTEPSGQQHAESMLEYGYFSHWDTYGMKPYMRYTLLGGNGSVTENIAYEQSESCTIISCSGNINPEQALQNMEYNMLYNDSACCNNGHRYNILDPNHNEVSIGVAYNSSTIYFVEDFIDNYIAWSSGTPVYSNSGEVFLKGKTSPGYSLSQIEVSYDPQAQSIPPSSAPQGSYSYGQGIAGVVSSPLYYYPKLETIAADSYSVNGSSFNIDFNIKKLISEYGAGEYTTMVFLNGTASGSNMTFVGSTYTVFINSTGGAYLPSGI